MFVTLERSYAHSVRSAIRDAIIVGVSATWSDACKAADDYCDDGLSAVAICTDTGRVYRTVGGETIADWIHTPAEEFKGMTASEYLEIRAGLSTLTSSRADA